MIRKLLALRTIRRIYAVFFLSLFISLIWVTSFRHLKGYDAALFLELDPLAAIASFLTSWTVYRGLSISVLIIVLTLEGFWTPVLINRIGYCEYNCLLCGHVCPTGAIMPLTLEKRLGKSLIRNRSG